MKEGKTFGETLVDLAQAMDRFKIGFGMILRLDKFMDWLIKTININQQERRLHNEKLLVRFTI